MKELRLFLEIVLGVVCVVLSATVNPVYCILAYLIGGRMIELYWGKV